MKVIYDACTTAGVDLPDEVNKFFDYSVPDDHGVEVELPAVEYEGDDRDGYELQVKDIPADVTIIRFYASY